MLETTKKSNSWTPHTHFGMGLADLDCILLFSGLGLLLVVALVVIYNLAQDRYNHMWDGKVHVVDIHPHGQHSGLENGGLQPIGFKEEATTKALETKVEVPNSKRVNSESKAWYEQIKKATTKMTHWADTPYVTPSDQDPLD